MQETKMRKVIIDSKVEEQVRDFLSRSTYRAQGGIITDLDGTIVHEERSRVYIPPPVQYALKELYSLGRPLIINSLRFPLSVIRTFGKDWYEISNAPIPTVVLNGSQYGFITKNANGELEFEELAAFPLTPKEIDEALKGVKQLLGDNIRDLLVFYYPRDWRMGEIIWTPVPEKVPQVKNKYLSASSVTAVEFDKLREQMLAEEICMIFLLVDVPEDKRMAYQHAKPRNFFTHEGVDKLFGARSITEKLELDLSNSVGAGDTDMDSFLSGVGLTIVVGERDLPFQGSFGTLRLKNAFELGDLLFRLATLQQEAGTLDTQPLETKVELARGEAE
jgi:hydroxymethylpyrimidine pyrophosphatase-like HAD family hydrolase